MEHAQKLGLKLTDKSGREVPASELSGKVVGVYFSAHWCPPCRGFTPVLKKFYEEVKGSGGAFEILFVSSDRSEEAGKEYYQNDHGDWLMVDMSQKDNLLSISRQL
jgi:nucleoredoxin